MNSFCNTLNEFNELCGFLERCYEAELDTSSLIAKLSPDQKEILHFYLDLARSQEKPATQLYQEFRLVLLSYANKNDALLSEALATKSLEKKLLIWNRQAVLTEDFVQRYWKVSPPPLKRALRESALENLVTPLSSSWQDYLAGNFQAFFASLKSGKNLFAIYEDTIRRSAGSILSAVRRDRNPSAQDVTVNDAELRAIAYSLDTLLPGFYLWFGGFRLRIGGSVPDDQPDFYPGVIHDRSGLAIVLPGYHSFSTYHGTHDA